MAQGDSSCLRDEIFVSDSFRLSETSNDTHVSTSKSRSRSIPSTNTSSLFSIFNTQLAKPKPAHTTISTSSISSFFSNTSSTFIESNSSLERAPHESYTSTLTDIPSHLLQRECKSGERKHKSSELRIRIENDLDFVNSAATSIVRAENIAAWDAEEPELGKENCRPSTSPHIVSVGDGVGCGNDHDGGGCGGEDDDAGGTDDPQSWEPKRKVLSFKAMSAAWEFKDDRIAPVFAKQCFKSTVRVVDGSESIRGVKSADFAQSRSGSDKWRGNEPENNVWATTLSVPKVTASVPETENAAKLVGRKLQERFGIDPDLFRLSNAVVVAQNKKSAISSKKRRI
jgi:hypothetical protein